MTELNCIYLLISNSKFINASLKEGQFKSENVALRCQHLIGEIQQAVGKLPRPNIWESFAKQFLDPRVSKGRVVRVHGERKEMESRFFSSEQILGKQLFQEDRKENQRKNKSKQENQERMTLEKLRKDIFRKKQDSNCFFQKDLCCNFVICVFSVIYVPLLYCLAQFFTHSSQQFSIS